MDIAKHFLKDTCIHAFKYNDVCYFINYSYQKISELLKFAEDEEALANLQKLELNDLINRDPNRIILVGVISKVHDDPLIPLDPNMKNDPELQDFYNYMVDLNGIDFHSMYWEHKTKPRIKEMMSANYSNVLLDDLKIDDFLQVVSVDYLAYHVTGELIEDQMNIFDMDLNQSIYGTLKTLPQDREYDYFILV